MSIKKQRQFTTDVVQQYLDILMQFVNLSESAVTSREPKASQIDHVHNEPVLCQRLRYLPIIYPINKLRDTFYLHKMRRML